MVWCVWWSVVECGVCVHDTCIRTYIRTYVHTYVQINMRRCVRMCIFTHFGIRM